jgi:Predicted flavin-nucleotide-binding protein
MRRKDREVKDIEGINDIIKSCKTCHVAMVDDGMPYVIPLSFGYRSATFLLVYCIRYSQDFLNPLSNLYPCLSLLDDLFKK